MRIDDFIRDFDRGIERMQNNIPDHYREAAISLKTSIDDRITEQGKFADGGSTGVYSTKPIYVNPDRLPVGVRRFRGTNKNKAGKTEKKSGAPFKTNYFAGGYNEFKSEIGRNQGFVDGQLSGDMWRNTGLIEEPVLNGNRIHLSIGPKTKENQDKMAGISKRFGTFLEASQSEVDEVREVLLSRVIKDLGL